MILILFFIFNLLTHVFKTGIVFVSLITFSFFIFFKNEKRTITLFIIKNAMKNSYMMVKILKKENWNPDIPVLTAPDISSLYNL